MLKILLLGRGGWKYFINWSHVNMIIYFSSFKYLNKAILVSFFTVKDRIYLY